jgi:hypothetical protein
MKKFVAAKRKSVLPSDQVAAEHANSKVLEKEGRPQGNSFCVDCCRVLLHLLDFCSSVNAGTDKEKDSCRGGCWTGMCGVHGLLRGQAVAAQAAVRTRVS